MNIYQCRYRYNNSLTYIITGWVGVDSAELLKNDFSSWLETIVLIFVENSIERKTQNKFYEKQYTTLTIIIIAMTMMMLILNTAQLQNLVQCFTFQSSSTKSLFLKSNEKTVHCIAEMKQLMFSYTRTQQPATTVWALIDVRKW